MVTNYRWPQWHDQYLESGASSDYFLVASGPATFIKTVLLDASRAEAVAQTQLEMLAQVLVYDA